jgi:hypothetical protein
LASRRCSSPARTAGTVWSRSLADRGRRRRSRDRPAPARRALDDGLPRGRRSPSTLAPLAPAYRRPTRDLAPAACSGLTGGIVTDRGDRLHLLRLLCSCGAVASITRCRRLAAKSGATTA